LEKPVYWVLLQEPAGRLFRISPRKSLLLQAERRSEVRRRLWRARRFNRLDPFFGRLNDPLSLHKYLYVHGDPIRGIDPTGEGLALQLAISALQVTLAVMGVAAVVQAYSWFAAIADPHPMNAPLAVYQARLDHLTTVASVAKRVGDAYAKDGLAGLQAQYPASGGFVPDPASPAGVVFPAEWARLSNYIGYMVERYDYIGRWGVRVKDCYTLGGAAINNPLSPGITMHSDTFWSNSNWTAIDFYLHEGFHDFGPGGWMPLGHEEARGIVTVEAGGRNAWNELHDFLYWHKDATGKRLMSYVMSEASVVAPSPPVPPAPLF